MGRPKLKLTLDAAAKQQLEEAFQAAREVRSRARLQAVRLASGGQHTHQQIAEIVGCARSTVQVWLGRYEQGGLEALLERKKAPGKPSPIQKAAVQRGLAEGLRKGRWRTAGQLRAWLKETHGIQRAPTTIYYWLGKCGGALKVPRPRHVKKQEGAAEAFKAHLSEKLEALDLPAGRRVKVWVMDECRLGLHTVTRRCWAMRGVRPVVPRQHRYQWQYEYGALEVVEGQSVFCRATTVDLDCHGMYLEQVAASDPEAEHVVIGDQAGFHLRPGDERLPERVHVVALPPYSPELNPVEKLWDVVQDGTCNRQFESLEEQAAVVEEQLRPYAEDRQRVLSLVGSGWLHDQANAS
jgi:transposase